MTGLVPPESPAEDDLAQLRVRAAELEATLDERTSDVDRVKVDLEAFRIDYRQRVGLLHEELDTLELAIAEVELGELSRLVEGATENPREPPVDVRTAPPPRFTTDGVRKLFRDVAKAIHPDLAPDDAARDRRHVLMAEANRAYALGDAQQLRWILDAWERSPEAVQGSDTEAMRLRLVRRIEQIEVHLETLAEDLAALKASPLWELKVMVDDAAAKGKDLVGEMVGRLKRDIMVARNRLDAMQPPR